MTTKQRTCVQVQSSWKDTVAPQPSMAVIRCDISYAPPLPWSAIASAHFGLSNLLRYSSRKTSCLSHQIQAATMLPTELNGFTVAGPLQRRRSPRVPVAWGPCQKSPRWSNQLPGHREPPGQQPSGRLCWRNTPAPQGFHWKHWDNIKSTRHRRI